MRGEIDRYGAAYLLHAIDCRPAGINFCDFASRMIRHSFTLPQQAEGIHMNAKNIGVSMLRDLRRDFEIVELIEREFYNLSSYPAQISM